MFAIEDSERNLVRAYVLCASKTPDDMKTPNSPLYFNQSHYKNRRYKTLAWFKSAPVGVNSFKFPVMKTMAKKAGFDVKNLSNHSRRKMIIQKLNDLARSILATHIFKSSRHKNAQNPNRYSTLSERHQKTSNSNIMSGYPGVQDHHEKPVS